ncbi:hypothetical protein AB0G74_16650 [Streptomyces sp. NPDC020875]|uniref:hypothetical protein n=1 Tax=Streptomyces sp. NPDC020875 TaxID=3154898 RepID=UPI0033C438C7
MWRHEQARAERARREAARGAAAEQRERQATADAVRQALACGDCGRERSAGLCEVCGHRRQTGALTVEAGLLAAAGSADLSDPGGVAAAVAEVRTAIGGSTAAAWQEFLQITDAATLEADPQAAADAYAFTAFQIAQQAVGAYQDNALMMLGRSETARAEARKAYATELAKPWHRAVPDSDDTHRAATEAAARAQTRTAEHLLAARLEELHTQTRPTPVQPETWAQRLPQLAARPLDGDTGAVTA